MTTNYLVGQPGVPQHAMFTLLNPNNPDRGAEPRSAGCPDLAAAKQALIHAAPLSTDYPAVA